MSTSHATYKEPSEQVDNIFSYGVSRSCKTGETLTISNGEPAGEACKDALPCLKFFKQEYISPSTLHMTSNQGGQEAVYESRCQ